MSRRWLDNQVAKTMRAIEVREQEESKSALSAGLCCDNTDKELWREKEDDFYSPSIHVTKDGKIGINIGGYVIVQDIRKWHELAKTT